MPTKAGRATLREVFELHRSFQDLETVEHKAAGPQSCDPGPGIWWWCVAISQRRSVWINSKRPSRLSYYMRLS